jgi:hypothetical protein
VAPMVARGRAAIEAREQEIGRAGARNWGFRAKREISGSGFRLLSEKEPDSGNGGSKKEERAGPRKTRWRQEGWGSTGLNPSCAGWVPYVGGTCWDEILKPGPVS